MVRVCPVSVLVMVIEKFGTTDPEGSVTVPTIVASWPKAREEKPARSTHKTRRWRALRRFASMRLSWQTDQKDFID
jgi:hypothetical protein